MKDIKKVFLGTLFALTVTLPALADYSQFDVKGTLDNSISVQVFDSTGTLFSGSDNTTTIPSIMFGKVNTLGQQPASGDIGSGVGGVAVNRFASLVNNGSSLSLQQSGAAVPTGAQVIAGLFAIEASGGAIRVQVDSMASASSSLSVDYTTQSGTPPDLVLSGANIALTDGALPSTGVAIIPVGTSGVLVAGANGGTGGIISSNPISNGMAGRLGMNIGLMAFNAAGGGILQDGAFTGRVKFIATP